MTAGREQPMVNFLSPKRIDYANKENHKHVNEFNKFRRRVGEFLRA